MPTLDSIKGIQAEDRELLEAAGWLDVRQLADSEVQAVRDELAKANEMLRLSSKVPSMERIGEWISSSRDMLGLPPEAPEEEGVTEAVDEEKDEAAKVEVPEGVEQAQNGHSGGPVNFEQDKDVLEMLKVAPMAIPIPNRILASEGISPSEITIAPVLNRAESDLDVRVTSRLRSKRPQPSLTAPKGRHAGVVKVADSKVGAGRQTLDTSRVRAMEREEEEEEEPHQVRRRQTRDERLTLLRTTKESTNRGRKPGTRRYIRGVLHDRPYKVWFGCLIVILFQLVVPVSIISAILLALAEHSPNKMEWIPEWIIVFPIALPILGLLYFMVSFGVKCRVCGQKVLVHRHCRKNKKAHHIFGLGYVLPLAVQTLLFRWFNCTFCGTSIRIKE